ncbi:MAG: hypothetical protein KGS61_15920, partial [Verrucomicrobia bacterium]|nr:hypothetical protein [Verrucomicrobiota bacterium]
MKLAAFEAMALRRASPRRFRLAWASPGLALLLVCWLSPLLHALADTDTRGGWHKYQHNPVLG